MHLIETALQIALKAHAGQKDKAGQPYILHPLRIMLQMETKEEMAAALLHDVLEDSEFTARDLSHAGIPAPIVEAVQVLTRSEDESYEDFITRVLTNKLAVTVKKADIKDNLNVLRIEDLSDKDLQRIAKYHKAWKRLKCSGQ